MSAKAIKFIPLALLATVLLLPAQTSWAYSRYVRHRRFEQRAGVGQLHLLTFDQAAELAPRERVRYVRLLRRAVVQAEREQIAFHSEQATAMNGVQPGKNVFGGGQNLFAILFMPHTFRANAASNSCYAGSDLAGRGILPTDKCIYAGNVSSYPTSGYQQPFQCKIVRRCHNGGVVCNPVVFGIPSYNQASCIPIDERHVATQQCNLGRQKLAAENRKNSEIAVQAYADDLTLLVGQSRALPAAPNEIVRVKGSHFISVRDDKIKIVATGRAPGEAQIIIGSRDYNIFVTGRKNQNLFTVLRDAVHTMLGLKIEMLDGRVTVTGQPHRLQDWIAISRIAANFDSPYIFRARIDNDVKARALNYFRNQLLSRNLPMPNLIWSPMAHAIIAQSDENLKNLWDEVLAPFGIARVYEKSAMSLKPLVRVKITIAEVNKSAERKLGVDWPDSVQQQLLPQMITPTLDVKLHALETRGLAQILASPTLLARSGSQASFLAGGEVPVRAATQYYQQVSYKTYGISLKIKPIADYSGRLSIDLTTEISQLDRANSNSVDQIPAFKTDQMTTHFDLPEPRTIILSGLIDNEWSKDTNDLPLLSHLPILGRLFGSEDFRKQRSELLIFVTPSIVNVQDENQKIQIPQLKNWDS